MPATRRDGPGGRHRDPAGLVAGGDRCAEARPRPA